MLSLAFCLTLSTHAHSYMHTCTHTHTHMHTHTHALFNYTLFVFFLKFFSISFSIIYNQLSTLLFLSLKLSSPTRRTRAFSLPLSLSHSYTHFLMEAVARKQNLYPISFQLSKYRIAICKRTAECFKPLQKGYFFYRALLLQIWLTDYGSRDSCP